MKLGFSSLAAIDQPLADLAQMLARTGYDGIELRGKDRQHVDPSMSAAERRQVRKLLADAGLQAAAVTSYALIAQDSADVAAAQQTLGAYIDLARDLGSPLLRVFGGHIPDGSDRAAVERRMADLLLSVADRAAGAGVKICLETHDAFTRAADLARVLAMAKHPNVVALWDVGNQFETGEPVAKAAELLAERLGYCHIKDSFALPGGKRQLCFLGAGDVPVAEVIAMLKARGFGGYLVVEWEKAWHPELADADVAAAQHILKLREYLTRAP
jgi:sugar phosphate isomerase/epimerase